jgi:hypothetical protein
MEAVTRGGLFAILIPLACLVAGCASDRSLPLIVPPRSGEVVLCDRCDVTWVRSPTFRGLGTREVVYEIGIAMPCADCHLAMRRFLESGEVTEGTCAHCGGHIDLRNIGPWTTP